MENKNIDILLSTYNGEKYLNALLESLSSQIYNNFRLLVRDDGSTDKSIEIIQSYMGKFPITFITDSENHIGPTQSFARLMSISTTEYIMLCDQDDIWLPNKILETYHCMKNTEINNSTSPVLIHSDLIVVDVDLAVISDSFWKYTRIDPNRTKVRDIIIQNIATGCTCMMNKALKELALPIPTNAIMHDWWLAIIATSFGTIKYVQTSQILYRQHENNDTGAKKHSLVHYFKYSKKSRATTFMKILKQAECFRLKYGFYLPEQIRIELNEFISIPYQSRYRRIKNFFKYKYRKHGIFRDIDFFITLFFLKK